MYTSFIYNFLIILNTHSLQPNILNKFLKNSLITLRHLSITLRHISIF